MLSNRMMSSSAVLLLLLAAAVALSEHVYPSGNNGDEEAAIRYLKYHNEVASEQCYLSVVASWNYASNLTEENKQKMLDQSAIHAKFEKEAWENVTSFAWKSFSDPLVRRHFKQLSILGNAALSDEKLRELNKLTADMEDVYSKAKLCPFESESKENCTLALEPEITEILKTSRDYDEQEYLWKSWRDSTGKKYKDQYIKYVNLMNEAANLNGFRDAGELWREGYESDTFEEDLEELWEQLRPFYEQLHAFIRKKLIQIYGKDKIRSDGPIPAHLLGNMWAQTWNSLFEDSVPYPDKPTVDVTETMKAKNMTALEMFKTSEEFFTSLGLKPMTPEFWNYSIIEKPKDREIICHASAWDFCNGKDFRIKQCTDINMNDLITVHHEMGHIEYYLQYAHQPLVFRTGANPGFHEAVGDVLALSVSTPAHLKAIDLLDEVADDYEGTINYLLNMALEKVAFLPFGYLIDLWRWQVFSGKTKPEVMNTKWWELRLKYQGLCPPVKRTNDDFDPGAKYHVAGGVPYIRYFVSFIIQFQFHKALCNAAEFTGPLYQCDIYRSENAGKLMSTVLELGSSKHWAEAMAIFTGEPKMDAQPLLEYFEPLMVWLKEQNNGEVIGWESGDPTICP